VQLVSRIADEIHETPLHEVVDIFRCVVVEEGGISGRGGGNLF
jgi:hypothetical protein